MGSIVQQMQATQTMFGLCPAVERSPEHWMYGCGRCNLLSIKTQQHSVEVVVIPSLELLLTPVLQQAP